MGRKSREKRERKIFGKTGGTSTDVELKNPHKHNFAQFVVGNADAWRVQYLNDWEKDGARLHEYRWWRMEDERLKFVDKAGALAAIHLPVVRVASQKLNRDPGVARQDSAKGRTVVICGAGPSLAEESEWIAKGHDVWGCNSALTWLLDHGHRVTHGFTVDQTPTMLLEWKGTPDVEYLCATTIHPHLTELLISRGRKIRWFNNYAGINGTNEKGEPVREIMIDGQKMPYEEWLYSLYFPATVVCGWGLNSVNRAVDLAQFMGYDKIHVLGADCAFRTKRPRPKAPEGSPKMLKWLAEETIFHADGGSAVVNGQSSLTFNGLIDGKRWYSKPDMLMSAVHLEMTRRESNGRIEIHGDTLPNALRDKDKKFMDRVASITLFDGKMVMKAEGVA